MLIALLLGLQLRAAATGGTLTVRTVTATERVPLIPDSTGPLLRPEMLAPLLPVSVTAQAAGHYRLVIAGTTFDLEVGVPSAVVGGQVRPLAAPPQLRDSRLFVPLQLVSELLPSVAPNLRWDASARQLEIFTRVAAAKPKPRLVV